MMAEFFANDTFETVIGGVIVLCVIALAIKSGPLRFLGEMLAHLVFKIVFIVVAIGVLFLFANTETGTAMGGVGTGLIVVLTSPFILLILGWGHAVWKRKSKAEQTDDTDNP